MKNFILLAMALGMGACTADLTEASEPIFVDFDAPKTQVDVTIVAQPVATPFLHVFLIGPDGTNIEGRDQNVVIIDHNMGGMEVAAGLTDQNGEFNPDLVFDPAMVLEIRTLDPALGVREVVNMKDLGIADLDQAMGLKVMIKLER
jgi:hypothetical protein